MMGSNRVVNLQEELYELNLKRTTLQTMFLATNLHRIVETLADQLGHRSVHRSLETISFLFCSNHPELWTHRNHMDFPSELLAAFAQKLLSRRRNGLPPSHQP
jgi:hypothetical protein